MRRKILEHIGSLAFVAVVFALLLVFLKHREAAEREARAHVVAPYLNLPGVDFGNPRDRALFKETLNLFRPASPSANDSLVSAIESFRQSLFSSLKLNPPLLAAAVAERSNPLLRPAPEPQPTSNMYLVSCRAPCLSLHSGTSN